MHVLHASPTGFTVVKSLTGNFIITEKVKLRMKYEAVLQRSNLLLLPGKSLRSKMSPLGFIEVGNCVQDQEEEKTDR